MIGWWAPSWWEGIEKAGVLTGLIADRVDVGAFKDELLEGDFGFVRMPVETRKRILAVAR